MASSTAQAKTGGLTCLSTRSLVWWDRVRTGAAGCGDQEEKRLPVVPPRGLGSDGAGGGSDLRLLRGGQTGGPQQETRQMGRAQPSASAGVRGPLGGTSSGGLLQGPCPHCPLAQI